MPNKCCVPGCKANYNNGPQLSVFSFPKDCELRSKWTREICRDGFIPTKNTKVCELHFKEHDIQRTISAYDEKTGKQISAPLSFPRLVNGAVPSEMPGCPKYLSRPSTSCEIPDTRRMRLENEALRNSIEESIASFQNYNDKNLFHSFQELKSKACDVNFPADWALLQKDYCVNFVLVKGTPHPRMHCAINISEDLILSAFIEDAEIHSLPCGKIPRKVSSISNIEDIINEINNVPCKSCQHLSIKNVIDLITNFLEHLDKVIPEMHRQIAFLREQILLLPLHKTCARYSWHLLIFCSLLHSISPHGYKYLRSSGNLRLLSPPTVRQVCSTFSSSPHLEQDPSKLLSYISSKFSMLSPQDKTVLLLIDEIHLKDILDYKAGYLVGNAFNNGECAISAYAFMITSMMSGYKEVVHILPVQTLTGELLHGVLKNIIIGLERIGFEVLAVVSDNHAINKKAMSLFADPPTVKTMYVHPKDETRVLYYVLDTVHILKCIRNNWLNKPNQEFLYPDFNESNPSKSNVASFSALKEMHYSERNNILRYGFNLSLKSLYPSSLERQNVKLALNIFNSHTAVALKELGCLKHFSHWETTSTFIAIICKWWDVVNVKTPLKGQRLKNQFQEPITQHSLHILEFLNSFLNWLSRWENLHSGGMLTKETHGALKHTTQALLHMAKYWVNEKGHSYFLCGKVQTDNLEERFGKYRQLFGAQYHVSVRQIFESESKLRIQNAMSLILKSHNLGEVSVHARKLDKVNFVCESEGLQKTVVPDILKSKCGVDDDDIDDIPESTWPVLTYIGGYNAYAVMKHIKCDYCKHHLIAERCGSYETLITSNNRGGLFYPHKDVVCYVSHLYVIVQKLIAKDNEKEFLNVINHKNVVISLGTMNIPDILFEGHNCVDHNVKDIIQKIMCVTANVLLNNYCKRKNDTLKRRTVSECERRKF